MAGEVAKLQVFKGELTLTHYKIGCEIGQIFTLIFPSKECQFNFGKTPELEVVSI